MKHALSFTSLILLVVSACSKTEVGADDARVAKVDAACPTTGRPMVKIDTPYGASFCIDKTVVTQKDYEEFVIANHGRDEVPGKLSGKGWCDGFPVLPVSRLYDDMLGTECLKKDYTPDVTPDAPVVCVSVCQARSYCQSIGKRLCGRVGGGALPVPTQASMTEVLETHDQPDHSELYFACSQGGRTRFAWGDAETAPPEQCTDGLCRGAEAPYDQIVGMSNGVVAPEERCEASGGCLYVAIGRNGEHPELNGACGVGGFIVTGTNTGIRCCADPR